MWGGLDNYSKRTEYKSAFVQLRLHTLTISFLPQVNLLREQPSLQISTLTLK